MPAFTIRRQLLRAKPYWSLALEEREVQLNLTPVVFFCQRKKKQNLTIPY